MKKLSLTLVLCFVTCCSFGQMSLECDTTFFHCNKILTDIQSYNMVYKKHRSDNKKWAMVLKDTFPVDKDKLLHFTYILQTDSIAKAGNPVIQSDSATNSALNMEMVKKVCADWYNIAFTSKAGSIKELTDNYIYGTGQFNMIGQTTIPAIIYYKIIKIHAQIDVIVRFKENRIKFEIIGRHYNYISGDSSGRSHNDLIVPGNVYPFAAVDNSYDREVYSQSYINFCNNSLALARSFLDYLNKNIHPATVQADDNW